MQGLVALLVISNAGVAPDEAKARAVIRSGRVGATLTIESNATPDPGDVRPTFR